MEAPGPSMSPEMLQKLADSPENQEKIANAGHIPRDAFIVSQICDASLRNWANSM
jgi:hypothetical protein